MKMISKESTKLPIKHYINKSGLFNTSDLCSYVRRVLNRPKLSNETIKRQLRELRKDGWTIRYHGKNIYSGILKN